MKALVYHGPGQRVWEDVADAADYDAKHRAQTKLSQLQELKAALKI